MYKEVRMAKDGMRVIKGKGAISQGKGLGGGSKGTKASSSYKANKSINNMKGKKPQVVQGQKGNAKMKPVVSQKAAIAKKTKPVTEGKKKQKRYPGENVKDKVPHSLEKKMGKKGKEQFNKAFKNAESFYTKKKGSTKKGKETAAKVAVKAVEKAGKFKGKSKAVTTKKKPTTKKKSTAKKGKKPMAEGNPVTPTQAMGKAMPTKARQRSMPKPFGKL